MKGSPRALCRGTIAAIALTAALALPACANDVPTALPPETTTPAGTSTSTTSIPNTSAQATGSAGASATASAVATMTFAVVGDYGMDDKHEKAVSAMISKWNPKFVITTGDDYYKPAGGTGTGKYDESTGAYYGRWLKDITTTGKRLPKGKASANAFFPSLGNHDYSDATPSPKTYLTYFRLPGAEFKNSSGNERYYDFVEGEVHFFCLNSNGDEPDGIGVRSRQAAWLKRQLARSTSRWNVIFDHHPPYSSDKQHGSTRALQWPFSDWGADAVFSGHAHTYERILRDRIPYFVNGLGGASRYSFRTSHVLGSKVRYRDNWGAQRVTVTPRMMRFEFFSISGKKVDSYTLSQ